MLRTGCGGDGGDEGVKPGCFGQSPEKARWTRWAGGGDAAGSGLGGWGEGDVQSLMSHPVGARAMGEMEPHHRGLLKQERISCMQGVQPSTRRKTWLPTLAAFASFFLFLEQ